MSGHSKWSTIKRKKGALDAKRGKLFSKLSKEISIAAKEGGSDADMNPRLRLAVQNAKGANMPKDNIERAISKGAGSDGADYTEVTYEGYGPQGVAIFVECLTDNLNRTVSSVRAAFTKHNGSLGTNGSVEYLFERKGVFSLKLSEGYDEDELTLEWIDGGAEDVVFEEGYATITSAMEDFGNVQSKLEEMDMEAESAQLDRLPMTLVTLDDDGFKKVMKLVEVLEENDDVQKVFHNLEVTDTQISLVE